MSKRKTKDQGAGGAHVKDGLSLNLPAVPSTQHLQPRDVHLASLFSTHRPISIHSSIPKQIGDSDFASIFAPRTKKNKSGPADVIYALSSAVKALDDVMQHQQVEGKPTEQNVSQTQEISQMRNEILQPGQNDNQSFQPQLRYFTDLKSAIDEIAKEWRPFNPPPAPVPMSEEQIAATEKAKQETASSPFLDLEKQASTVDDNYIQEIIIVNPSENGKDGSVPPEFFTSQFYDQQTGQFSEQENFHPEPLLPTLQNPGFSSQLTRRNRLRRRSSLRLPSSSPQSSQGTTTHMGRRESMREPTKTQIIIHAISVKRQRKLKMKKHKYKKLMRKTRNLRRKLDQL